MLCIRSTKHKLWPVVVVSVTVIRDTDEHGAGRVVAARRVVVFEDRAVRSRVILGFEKDVNEVFW